MAKIAVTTRVAESTMVGVIRSNEVAIVINPIMEEDDTWQGRFELRCKGVPADGSGSMFLYTIIGNVMRQLESEND